MKKLAFGLAFVCLTATAGLAQSETPKTSQTTPAVSTSGETNPGAPVAGKNSFTESQAKSRMEEAGYQDVSGLKLDDQGVWRATASKDGKQGNVSLDFQGNIVMAK
ncbi:PepSY domain-containing protein [Rhizobium lusitanum]|uniref:PepSY domain-containing protein n=1 Tax=Rhizobium lusitanum TaxID=293958 RepID=A0A6L9UB03_9HYPH|nr:PepSY domain-containing protein [Rhizobium lusitanum]NEI73215.1 PepSY domain-containing protein [Rhizobium lusitanum]